MLPRLEGGYRVEGIGVDEGIYQVGALGEFTITQATSFGYATGQTVIGQTYQFSLDTPVPQEITGTLILETEQFVSHIGRSNRVWSIENDVTGYSGTGYVSSVPDTGLRLTDKLTSTSPELQYTLNISTTGIYTLWLKGYAPNGAGDSVSVGLDNQLVTELSGFAPGQWSWNAKNSTAPQELVTLNITTPGLHILHLWMREDGLLIDKIVLTTDPTYNPDVP